MSFYLNEERVHAVDDSPTIGAYSETHLESRSHGSFDTKEKAWTRMQELMAQYEKDGWRRCHSPNTWMSRSKESQAGQDEIHFTIS